VYPNDRGSRVYPNGRDSGARPGRGSRVYPNGRDSGARAGRGSRVYPNGQGSQARPGRGRGVGVLGLRPHSSRNALRAHSHSLRYTHTTIILYA